MSVTGFITPAPEEESVDEMRKKNRILMQVGELLFQQGLIDIKEKQKYDESICQ